jgi:flavodoxin
MTKVLVVYGSRHGGTEGIAQRIGEVLRAQGLASSVVSGDAVAADDVRDADAFVIGSAVYMGSWLKEPTEFLENFPTVLRSRPVWLFSSGPLPGSTASKDANDPLTDALGPKAGPGSGGRKKPLAHATTGSSSAGTTRMPHRDRSRNASSGCCRSRRVCSRTATSGTGRTSRRGPARSRPQWPRRSCRSDPA